ncbi:heat-inducible transcriptional repressor HrcA [Pelotomaculum isophthalicicum JI]|uniref:Heat-inducible transcription repressor HrcA n=1 Tax=Pelotomaculum isophthalicicum JI TaxID=947010 RepID=A0A9X4JUH9_9FIRM|nr:heat-inducible transcriptional repressor HrcA [Pelotomaculum isophthalicicum]MDF9409295.1 heat-inducible transcriptional repressor HrcA [Pelotomaculum isophthalicicum JI]
MDDRKQKVLLAIVHDYIATAEPVGSRTIAKKYKLGVSPATIRNEMSDLEEQGYIEQPYTSAGRIPSERGYRYYVDFLMRKQELSREEEELIRREYRAKVRDVGQVIHRTGLLLSQLTHYTAMVLTPRIGISILKHVQIVYMHQSQAMVIAVMDNGAVQHRMIEIPESITALDMETISRVLNAKLQGLTMKSIKLNLIKEIYSELARHKHILDLVMELIQDSLTLEVEDKIYLGGVFNMLNQPEFHNVEKIKTMLSIMEQEKLLCDILEGRVEDEGVTVRIGGEIDQWDMKECSMITAPYTVRGRKMGSLGVLGPTRMEYAKVVSVVDYMTKYLSQTLERMIRGKRK